MRTKTLFVLLVAICSLVGGFGIGAAPQSETLLGTAGEVFGVKAGSHAALFGSGSEAPVLALGVQWPDGAQQRYLVPGTEDAATEGHPFLLLDRETQTLYLLWESFVGGLHPILNLVSFQGGLWSESTQIVYNPFVPKTAPQMLVHHDDVQQLDPEGNATTRRRTVVHVVWSEEEADGSSTYYVPLVLGQSVSLHESVVRLNDLVAPSTADAEPEVAAGPAPGVKLQVGRDQRRVLVAFPIEAGREIAVVELDLLPGDLASLADEARGHIIDFGARNGPVSPADVGRVADEARGHIIDFGVAYHPEVVKAIAEEARGHIIDFGARSDATTPLDIRSIADSARGHIIDFGSKLTERGLRRVHDASQTTLLEVAPANEEMASSPILIQVKPLASHVRPDLGGAATHHFISAGGDQMVLARAEADRVFYRQLTGDSWSPLRELKLSEAFDLDAALGVLEGRTASD